MLTSTKLGFPVIQPRLNLFPPVVQPRLNFTAVTWELQRWLNLFECTNGGCSGRVDGGAYIYWAELLDDRPILRDQTDSDAEQEPET